MDGRWDEMRKITAYGKVSSCTQLSVCYKKQKCEPHHACVSLSRPGFWGGGAYGNEPDHLYI